MTPKWFMSGFQALSLAALTVALASLAGVDRDSLAELEPWPYAAEAARARAFVRLANVAELLRG